MIEDELISALDLLNSEAGTPEVLIMSEKAYWCISYVQGRARYKPRMPGQRSHLDGWGPKKSNK